MPIPDYQTVMLPLLRLLADGEERSLREVRESIANEFALTEAEREELLPSGNSTYLANRVGWARTYLKKAGLLAYSRRGVLLITDAGSDTLSQNPKRIDVKFLERFPAFIEFRSAKKDKSAIPPETENAITPEEALDTAYGRIRGDLEAELLDQIKASSPRFFEQLVIDLLVAMGYGGSRSDARAVGRSGDGGIDGIINEDRLGLDVVYVQAKRWEGTVGRPEIQKFAGALQGHRARKGVFITTSSFTREAQEYRKTIEARIVLIDGAALVRLMVDHDLGVATSAAYYVKRIDSDYFSEE